MNCYTLMPGTENMEMISHEIMFHVNKIMFYAANGFKEIICDSIRIGKMHTLR